MTGGGENGSNWRLKLNIKLPLNKLTREKIINNSIQNGFNAVDFWILIFVLLVLYLHHDAYTVNAIYFINNLFMFDLFIMYLAVGGFIFLSGYKLAKAKIDHAFKEFWINRIIRIYPLYILAVILFSIIVEKSFNTGNFIVNALGLQSILPNLFGTDYLTLWFVSLIVSYYLIFSLVKKYISNFKNFSLILLVIFLICFFIHQSFQIFNIHVFSANFFIFYPIFFSGMISSYYKLRIIEISYFRKKNLFILSLIILLLFFIFSYIITYNHRPIVDFYNFVSINLILIPIYIAITSIDFHSYQHSEIISKVIRSLGYASFCIYLFHRPIWQIMENIWSERSVAQWAYITIFGFSIIFFLSYLLQYSYNIMVSKLKKT